MLLLRRKLLEKMVNQFFIDQIKAVFPYILTSDQSNALRLIVDFLTSREPNVAFILRGYAGTGKSSLIGSLVQTMTKFKQKCVLLAPTGRAAKVFSTYANHPAYTIHKRIYRQNRFAEDSPYSISPNLSRDTLFIVDEASMLSNSQDMSSGFGSGCLLDDLIQYVYATEGCRLLLLGDTAQLPPVHQETSPALDASTLALYNLSVSQAELREIVRQNEDSGILYNATALRNALLMGDTFDFPKIQTAGFRDTQLISGGELIEALSSAYSRDGIEETMVISRSNKRVTAYNRGIRNSVLYKEEELSSGDMLMITKNNYHWGKECEEIDFLANGEFVEVVRYRGEQSLYGFRFATVVLRHRDYDVEFEAKIILDSLHTDTPGLTRDQQEALFNAVMEDYADVPQKAQRYKKLKEDPFFNALQVKYGYAVTCHKAQGGEWQNVFLDLGYVDESYMDDSFYRWLYTAITRSTNMLYLVNLPKDFIPNKK